MKFIGVKPITFSYKTYDKKNEYYLTYKLDGERRLLYINNNECYYIDSKSKKTNIECSIKHLNDTILDGELYNGILYIFDILRYKGESMIAKNLNERIKILNTIKKIPFIKIKKYVKSKNIYNSFVKLKNKYKHEMTTGTVDGIIFTPNDGYYSNVLKWKPIELLSIDFKIFKKNGIFYLLKQNGKLYIPKYSKYKYISKMKVDINTYDLYKSGDVIEVILVDNKFKFLRNRPDKTKSNYDTVIDSNFEQMVQPDSIEKILKN